MYIDPSSFYDDDFFLRFEGPIFYWFGWKSLETGELGLEHPTLVEQ